MKYNCIVIDDEKPARQLVETYCSRIPELNLVGSYKSALEVYSILSTEEIHILFLDIQMPDINGLDFLKSIQHRPEIILTTAYREHAIEAYNLDVIDYLLKPIEFHRFLRAVNKVREKYAAAHPVQPTPSTAESLLLKSDKKIYKIDPQDIHFVKSESEYLTYVTKSQGKLHVYGALKDLESQLVPNQFVRVHRSYIVNVKSIQYLEGNRICIQDSFVPISETYKKNLMEVLR